MICLHKLYPIQTCDKMGIEVGLDFSEGKNSEGKVEEKRENKL